MKKNLALLLRSASVIALALVFAFAMGFVRPAYAEGDTAAAPDEAVGSSSEDGEMGITTIGAEDDEADDVINEADDAIGEAEDAVGSAESALTTGADDGAEDEGMSEKSIKLYTVIAALLALAVVIAVYFAFRGKNAEKVTTRQLVESALMIAIGTVLSLIKIDSPFGGGVTVVSMLPLVLISHRWGWRWGVVTAFVYSVIQLMLGLDNVAYATTFMMAVGIILLDYIVAYSVIGLSGIFGKSRGAVATGIAVTFTLRFLCHWVTGAIIWGVWMPDEFWGLPMTNPWVYSAMYNGWYMAIELAATMLVAMLIYKPLEKYIRNEG